jgi:hypothetical protein
LNGGPRTFVDSDNDYSTLSEVVRTTHDANTNRSKVLKQGLIEQQSDSHSHRINDVESGYKLFKKDKPNDEHSPIVRAVQCYIFDYGIAIQHFAQRLD